MVHATDLEATFHNEAKLLTWPIPSLTPLPWLWVYLKAQFLDEFYFSFYVNDLLSVPTLCHAMGYVEDTKIVVLAFPQIIFQMQLLH